MRIICTVTTDLVYDQRMQRICTSLSNAGYDVCLVGRRKRNSTVLPSMPYRQHRINVRPERGAMFYLIFNLRLFLWMLFRPVDVIYSVDHDTLLAGWMVGGLRRKKRVYDAHEWFEELPELQGRGLVRNIWKAIGRLCISGSNLCITVNDALAAQLQELHGRTFEVIRNVPFEREFNEVARAEVPTIIYQGALNKGRKLEMLIDAMPLIPDWQCWLVGEGDLTDELHTMASRSSASDRIHFPGRMSPEDLAKHTPQAHLGYNLLDASSKNYFFSLANKYFDYMHAGVPSLNPKFPAYLSALQSYNVGYVLNPGDPAELADFINSIEVDDNKYLDKVETCKKARKTEHWGEEAKKLLRLFESLD